MDIAAMAMQISNWQMANFKSDLSISVSKMQMDTARQAGDLLVGGMQSSAPSTGMMDIRV